MASGLFFPILRDMRRLLCLRVKADTKQIPRIRRARIILIVQILTMKTAIVIKRAIRKLWFPLALSALFCIAGCSSLHHTTPIEAARAASTLHGPMPTELAKVVMPEYIIEPPDLLMIEAINVRPKQPYRLRSGDLIQVDVAGALPDAPIAGAFALQADAILDLGPPYGKVRLSSQTEEEARTAVEQHLLQFLREPTVTLRLLQTLGVQQIAGIHLVTPDGDVNLGTYGSVPVFGMSLDQAKAAIESHLSVFLEEPQVSVDVFAYNSKVFYIITEGGGTGDQVVRLPVTGNETVLDAISQVGGLSGISSKRIWIARPTPNPGHVQVLPVDWVAITAQGVPATNYQIMPGDRIFIAEDEWVAFDTRLAKFTAPIERVAGFSILMVGTLSRFTGRVLGGGGGGFGGGIVNPF